MLENAINIKEKLSQSRQLCPGMSENIYFFADYLFEIIPEVVTPLELVSCLKSAIDGLCCERMWMSIIKNEELRLHLQYDRRKVLMQAKNVPLLIEAIAEKSFSEEFQLLCREILGFAPALHRHKKIEEYPEYVQVAVNWWANLINITLTTHANDGSPDSILYDIANESAVPYSEEQLNIYKTALAEEIIEEMEAYDICILSVDYHPCPLLEAAGNKIELGFFSYPPKARMYIYEYEVTASVGFSKPTEIIWTSK